MRLRPKGGHALRKVRLVCVPALSRTDLRGPPTQQGPAEAVLLERLGGRPNLEDPFPARPKGQRRKKYDRLRGRAEAAERRRTEAHLRAVREAAAFFPHLAETKLDFDELEEVQRQVNWLRKRRAAMRRPSREQLHVHV